MMMKPKPTAPQAVLFVALLVCAGIAFFAWRASSSSAQTPVDIAIDMDITGNDGRLSGGADIQDCGEITGDIEADRKCVRAALADLSDFEGITGRLVFDEEGDPIKCAIMARISDEGEFEFYKWICPEQLE